jgi:hypothetical protein
MGYSVPVLFILFKFKEFLVGELSNDFFSQISQTTTMVGAEREFFEHSVELLDRRKWPVRNSTIFLSSSTGTDERSRIKAPFTLHTVLVFFPD